MKKFMNEYGISIMLALIIILSIFNICCSIKLIKDKLSQGTVSEMVNNPGDRYSLVYTYKV